MKVYIDDYKKLINSEPLTLTIGNFDGLHVGHQELINKAVSFSDTKSALLSFDPHPEKLLRDVRHQKLMTTEQKVELLKDFNLDKVFIVNFTKEFGQLSVDEFICFLKNLAVKRIVIGRDFRFGAYAKGHVDDLKKHFLVEIVPDVLINNTRISSTYVKNLIYTGEVEKAAKLLGHYYEITGVVIHGDKVGRTLKIPTANLFYNDFVLPKNGVYFSTVEYEGNIYAGALNIGYNPTINYSLTKRAEVHILDFNEEIYDKSLKIKIIKYLRPELKFKNKEELVEQMKNDLKKCEELFLKENK